MKIWTKNVIYLVIYLLNDFLLSAHIKMLSLKNCENVIIFFKRNLVVNVSTGPISHFFIICEN